jgi:protoheme IX farnesyltransferase
MGYVSTGACLTPSALLIPIVLFCWQFPHFNALSHNLRNEYTKAGYYMTCVLNPEKNARDALGYAILLIPVCISGVVAGLVSAWFLVGSMAVNFYMVSKAYKFHKNR